ncbi:MAG: UDP-N-acetylmuramoyl-L-alanine--D-glutamate ligase [Desulfobacteraceae bacterium]|nr:UDP-N-acetylmuramoyl-L-alanine--D-glutamate ligase [Desulfobacteraceae bacterium]
MHLKDRHVVVFGLGRSGLAVTRFLRSRGARVTITDQAGPKELGDFVETASQLGAELELGGHCSDTLTSADLVVISPGVAHTIEPLNQARQRNVEVIGEIELACRFIKTPIIAVSGTNGKTTTTELLTRMLVSSGLKVFTGGNIGTPLIEIAGADESLDVVIAEISSFQLDTADSFKPHVAVLLNITPDHLDRYSSLEDYARSKGRLFKNQGIEDFAICNGDDDTVKQQCSRIASRLLLFCRSLPQEDKPRPCATIMPGAIHFYIPGLATGKIDLSKTGLTGPHNHENIAAAGLAALSAGAALESLQSAVDQFHALAHRLEPVGTVNGVDFVNDSKATNTDAVIRALECFDRPILLIMGGRNKGYDFSSLKNLIRRHVKKLFVLGQAGSQIMACLGNYPAHGTEMTPDLEAAVVQAYKSAEKGDTVLLSPGCASFDMFTSYAQRGDTFRRLVGELT